MPSSWIALLLCLGLGATSGSLSGLLGIGGGALLPPMLSLLLGIDQHLAQGISLAALLPPVGLPAVLAYQRAGVRVDSKRVLLLLAGFLGGVGIGAWGAHRVADRPLRWLFAGFLLVSAWRTLRRPSTPTLPSIDKGGNATQKKPVAIRTMLIGALAGIMSGLLGVGGGLVSLPLLQHWLGLRRLEAQATTLAMMLPPIGLPAVWVYAHEQGGLPWPLLGAVAGGFALGAGWGARAAGRWSPITSLRIYAGVLVLVAALLLAKR